MSKELIQELEEILLPYVKERCKSVEISDDFQHIMENLATALLLCLVNLMEGKIHLKEIVSITTADVFNEMGLFHLIDQLKVLYDSVGLDDLILILPAEIHNWLIYLQKRGKLPGIYERFTGFLILPTPKYF